MGEARTAARLIRALRRGHPEVTGVRIRGRDVIPERHAVSRRKLLNCLAYLSPGEHTLDEVGRGAGWAHLPDPGRGVRGDVLWAVDKLPELIRLDGNTVVILQEIS